MIALPRAALKRLRTLARRGAPPGRARGPAPPVRLSARAGVAVLAVHLGDVVVQLHFPDVEGELEPIVLRLSDLDRLGGGRGADTIQMERLSPTRIRVNWQVGSAPVHCELESVETDLVWPAPPGDLVMIPSSFLAVLHEAGRGTASEDSKYALARIRIRGQAGQVISSDANQFLVQGGFTLPFPDDLLVPAVPIFGSRELAREAASVGYDAPWLCIGAGPWRIFLKHNADARYPNVFEVIPKSARTTLHFHERDIETMLEVLAMPCPEGQRSRPVTLVLGETVCMRIGLSADEILEAPLLNSTCQGPDVCLVVDSELLGRGLDLGFREFAVAQPNRPIHACDRERIYLCVTQDPLTALPAAPNSVGTSGRLRSSDFVPSNPLATVPAAAISGPANAVPIPFGIPVGVNDSGLVIRDGRTPVTEPMRIDAGLGHVPERLALPASPSTWTP